MKMKNCVKILVATLISLTGVSSLNAEVFTKTYSTTMSDQDFNEISQTMIGPGFASNPSGDPIGGMQGVQFGVFSNLVATCIPSFTNGIILSTGNIYDGASKTNMSAHWSYGSDRESLHQEDDGDCDPDLSEFFGEHFRDSAGFILKLKPKNSTINIPFVMASEEFFYQEDDDQAIPECPTLDEYKDGFDRFAIFLKEEQPDDDGTMKPFRNLARLPNGENIGIATINQHTNTKYFISNVVSNNYGNLVFPTNDIALPMEFNGAINGTCDGLVAVATNLDTTKTYKLKIVIADGGDENIWNSVLLLRTEGITSGADLKVDIAGPAFIKESGNVVFTNTVSNIGPAPADGVVVTNYLPVGATYIECNTFGVGSVEEKGGFLVWNLGDGFKSGSNAVMKVSCNLPTAGVAYTNRAHVVTSTGDYDESNNRDKCETVVLATDTTALTIKVNDQSRKYNGQPLEPTYSVVEGLGTGDTVEAVTFTVNSITDAGTTNVSISGCTVKRDGVDVTDKYTLVPVEGTLEVTKRSVTLTSQGGTKPHDGTALENHTDPAVSGDGFITGEGVESYSFTGSQTSVGQSDNEFTYTLKTNTKKDNYDIEPVYGKLIVTPPLMPLTIKVDRNIKPYDRLPLLATYTSEGLAAGDVLDVTFDIESIIDVGSNDVKVATRSVKRGGVDVTAEYAITSIQGSLEVTKRPLEITAKSRQKEYGRSLAFAGRMSEIKITGGSLLAGDSIGSVTLTCDDGRVKGAIYKVEGYQIEVSNADGVGLANYAITYKPGKLMIIKKPLTVKANDRTKTYGDGVTFAGTEFTITSGSLENNDTLTSVTLTSAGAAKTAAYKAEGYPIVPSDAQGDGLANYAITYADGTLTVNKRALTVKANDRTKTYGEVATFAGTEFTISSGSLENNDTLTSVTLTSAGAAKTAVYKAEGYPIVPSAAQGTGLANYTVTYADGTLTVAKRAITVKANDRTKTYGDSVAFAGTEFTISSGSLENNDTLTSVTLTSAGAAEGAVYKAEGYPIVPSDAQGGGLVNYAITYADGTLTVAKRAITVKANDRTKAYGEGVTFAGTEFTISAGSLKNNDTLTSVTLTSAGAATTASYKKEGYPIVPSAAQGTGLVNYAITYANGKLMVGRIDITITANDATKTYGEKLTFAGTEFTVIGNLPNGERVTSVNIASEKAANASAEVGEHEKEIAPSHTVKGINTNNYNITFLSGTLKVTQAALTVKVNDAKWNIKKPKPTYSFADFTSQLKGGDTVASVVGGAGLSQSDYTNKVWATKVPVKGDEGKYPDEIWIKLTGFKGPRAPNYLITIDPGDLTVDTALPELKTTVEAKLNRKDGLLYLKLTIENTGDGDVEPDSDYWVELKPGDGPVTDSKGNTYARSYEIRSKTKTMPDGYDYQDLTAFVKAALRKIHRNADEAFHPDDVVKIGISDAGFVPDAEVNISVFHYLRWAPEHFIADSSKFFIAGQLFNVADTDRNFKVSNAEKTAAAKLLGENSADYLEVTRLQLLPYYHWSTADQTWK